MSEGRHEGTAGVPSAVEEADHRGRVGRLADLLERHGPGPGPPFPCSYLPDRSARHLTVAFSSSAPGLYHALMDLNFRRSGSVFYRPACDGCRECRMIRLPAASFRPSRSQRRCLARNTDLAVALGPPEPTAEKHALYVRYLAARHDGTMDGSWTEFASFLYDSSLETLEVAFRRGERLVGVGLVDVEPRALSAVYFYFDPAESARSLGVFNVLWLLAECRRRGLPYLYLGYQVPGSRTMAYKADYRPHELLSTDGRWEAGQGSPGTP